MRPRRFWVSSILVTATVALLTALLFPYGLLDIHSPGERRDAWLLTLWTSGVMAVCFGVAGLLSSITPPGFREVVEAGSVAAARDSRRFGRPGLYNFAGWTITTGAFLILAYLIAWLTG